MSTKAGESTTIGRAGLMLGLATLGFALCFWAWALLSPLAVSFTAALHLTPFQQALLVAVPVVVGSLGRIVVGGLTDRYGGRVMFPIVSAATIVPILFIAFFALDSYALLLVGGFFLGIAGTAFAVGVPFVNAWFPPETRGLAIGIFGAGMGGTAISALTTVKLIRPPRRQGAVPDHRRRAGRATRVVAWLVLRDAPGRVVPTDLAGVADLGQRPAPDHLAGLPPLRGRLRWVRRVLGLPAGVPQDRPRPHPGRRGQPDGRLRARRGHHASGRRLALRPARRDPGARHRLRRRRRRRRRSRPGHPPAARHRHGRVPRHGRRARLRQRGHLRPDRQGHRPVPGRRRDRPRRRRRRSRRVRPAADHGLRLRPHRLLRASGCGCCAVTAAARPAAHRHRRPPYRRPGTGSSFDPSRSCADDREDADHRSAWTGRPLRRRARPQPAVLHPRDRLRRPADPVQGRGPRGRRLLPGPVEPRQGRALHPRRELHRAPARGRSTSRTGSSPGRPSRPTTRRSARTPRSTSPAAAPAARRSPGTPTRRPGSATPTCAASCSRCSARPRPSTTATRCRPGSTSSRTRCGPRPTSPRAARAAWSAPPGTRPAEIVAAAHVHTIKKYGPDRVAGFSPIPAMSMVSHASGARFVNLIGGSMLSFYDWYADLPVASPQVFGDQTDVPESGDWWNAGYLIMWGSNLPVTRTPDAHWMTEARYRGQKVIAVAPDYADNVKFADEWLPAKPGTDAALAMAMGHVVLKEFFVDRQTPYFTEYVKTYTDLPHLVRLEEAGDGEYTAGKFLTAADLADHAGDENAAFKTVLIDAAHRRARRPERLPGSPLRRGRRRQVEPRARRRRPGPLAARHRRASRSSSGCRASTPPTARPPTCRAACPSAASTATWSPPSSTCCSRSTACALGRRAGLPGEWADGYDDAESPYTPAWQEAITGVPAATAARIGREFAAERRGVPGPLDDRDGRRHQPLVPLRHDLPRVPHPHQPDRLPGRQRRRLGALRRPGEGPPDHRLHPDRQRARLEPAAAQHDPDRVLVPAHRPVPLRPVRRRHPRPPPPARASSPGSPPPT